MINYYLKYEKQPDRKSRFNLLSHSIPLYESEMFMPGFKPFVYVCTNPHIKANNERKSDLQITWNGKNLSSLYFIDVEQPEFAFGDVYKTDDLILIVKKHNELELFILKDKLYHKEAVLDLFSDGELKNEMEFYRSNSKKYTQPER